MSQKLNIGMIIRKGRLKKDMSQKQLADIMGARPPQISKWENNLLIPRGDDLIKLANVLDIVYDLFPAHKPKKIANSNQNKIEKEIENIWKTIRQKEQEEADFKKIILLLLKEKIEHSEEEKTTLG